MHRQSRIADAVQLQFRMIHRSDITRQGAGFRSSRVLAVPSDADAGIKGTLQKFDKGAASGFRFPGGPRRYFKSTAPGLVARPWRQNSAAKP